MLKKHKKNNKTRLDIIKLASKLFIEEGYTNTSAMKICKKLNISPGNLTFYFPSKEHLLAVIIDELFRFQDEILSKEMDEGMTSLHAYCLELTAISAICEEDDIARDFYVSCYTSSIVLELIRKNDTIKTKNIFSKYRPEWDDNMWKYTENVVSGIEFGTIMTREDNTPLENQIERTLSAILNIYGVDENTINSTINQILNMDYRMLGKRILDEFKKYVYTFDDFE